MYGQFTWYELITPDTKGAEAFYGAVVGWTAQVQPGGEAPYTVFCAGGRGEAGMLEMTDAMKAAGGRPGWIGYIVAQDVDATIADLIKAGGKVHRPAVDVPGMLRFAVVADPQGMVFTVFTPDASMTAPPPPPAGAPGTFGWSELVTSDWAAAWDFYAGLFGWTKGMTLDMGPMGVYQTFGVGGGVQIGGMMNKPPQMPGPGHWAHYINVDTLDAAIERVKAAGGTIFNGPHEVPGPMYVAQGFDPQGAMFSLLASKL